LLSRLARSKADPRVRLIPSPLANINFPREYSAIEWAKAHKIFWPKYPGVCIAISMKGLFM
jgi:hypothetical protein